MKVTDGDTGKSNSKSASISFDIQSFCNTRIQSLRRHITTIHSHYFNTFLGISFCHLVGVAIALAASFFSASSFFHVIRCYSLNLEKPPLGCNHHFHHSTLPI